MLETPLEYPPLPEDINMLCPGWVYAIPESPDIRVVLTHCTGLNCSQNTATGLQVGLISPDNYNSTPFTPKAGTLIRVVQPIEGSCRCANCNRHCVTLGPNDSDNVYNIIYEPHDNLPKYSSTLDRTPIGSIIMFPEIIYGRQVSGDTLGKYTDPLSSGLKYITGLSAAGHTVSPLEGGRLINGNTYALPSNTIVRILTTPEGSQIWATCWEERDFTPSGRNLKKSIQAILGKLLEK